MRYLLDTHCLIWFQEANPKMPDGVMKLIRNPENIILFSQLSLYEIAIKQKIGKLPQFLATITDVHQQALKDNFTFLPIDNKHVEAYKEIPLLEDHRDPFDRLLIATAYVEKVEVMSGDKNFGLYPDFIKVQWKSLE